MLEDENRQKKNKIRQEILAEMGVFSMENLFHPEKVMENYEKERLEEENAKEEERKYKQQEVIEKRKLAKKAAEEKRRRALGQTTEVLPYQKQKQVSRMNVAEHLAGLGLQKKRQ